MAYVSCLNTTCFMVSLTGLLLTIVMLQPCKYITAMLYKQQFQLSVYKYNNCSYYITSIKIVDPNYKTFFVKQNHECEYCPISEKILGIRTLLLILCALLMVLSFASCFCKCEPIYYVEAQRRNTNTNTSTNMSTVITIPKLIEYKFDKCQSGECLICLEHGKELVKMHNCDCAKGGYHDTCLKSWLQHNNICPVCRKN